MEKVRKKKKWKFDSNQIILQVIALIGIAWFIIFSYIPFIGLTLAFREFRITDNMWDFSNVTWVGLDHFRQLFSGIQLPRIIRNTFAINLMKLLTGLPAAVLFALLLNEIPRVKYKKTVQTISFFPHFIPWVIVALLAVYFFSPSFGMLNSWLIGWGVIDRPLMWLHSADHTWWLFTWLELWKSLGWSSILFIAAVSGVDPTLYEAAVVDGATRWHKMYHISLPAIKGVVVLVFILQFSGLFSAIGGTFEQSVFLGNALNSSRSMVLGHYILETGIALGRFPYATAAGLVLGLVGLTMLTIANLACRFFLGRGLYTGGEGR